MKHPYFSNPMIYLPLVLMGIDKIYKREKPWLFIWATAVSAMSNFYFFLKALDLPGQDSPKQNWIMTGTVYPQELDEYADEITKVQTRYEHCEG